MINSILDIHRRLNVSLQQSYHMLYIDIRFSQEALEYVNSHSHSHTPVEIFRDLQSLRIPGADVIAQHQTAYQWQRTNSSTWRRDADQIVSATKLLGESESMPHYVVYFPGNSRGVAIYFNGAISALISKTQGLVIDAIYGINSSDINNSYSGSGATPAGATTCILRQFLQPLKDYGFNLAFFGCDKDRAEISAIRLVWPSSKIQLCFWHAKKAIRNKLQDFGKMQNQQQYFPEKAKSFVPTLKIFSDLNPICRPDGEHRYDRWQYLSISTEFDQPGRLETVNVAERNLVLLIFRRHFNMHSIYPITMVLLK